MKRTISAVGGGFVCWWATATLGGLALRAMWPEYAAVEGSVDFTLAMHIDRLLISAVASLCAGYLPLRIDTPGSRSALWLGIQLLVFFLPLRLLAG
jgi:hypothetical protein